MTQFDPDFRFKLEFEVEYFNPVSQFKCLQSYVFKNLNDATQIVIYRDFQV